MTYSNWRNLMRMPSSVYTLMFVLSILILGACGARQNPGTTATTPKIRTTVSILLATFELAPTPESVPNRYWCVELECPNNSSGARLEFDKLYCDQLLVGEIVIPTGTKRISRDGGKGKHMDCYDGPVQTIGIR